METRFVEVFEQRARELKSDFVITDLTKGFDFSDAVIGGRFAQDTDEFGNIYEPLAEDQNRANLLKGSTNLGFTFLNNGSPISLNLRALEAAGVINITNAPNVTTLNGETVDFIIERELGLRQPQAGATGGDANQFTAVASETPVNLSLTPTITAGGAITIEIEVEIRDRESNLGNQLTLAATTGGGGNGTTDDTTTIPRAQAIRASLGYAILRKDLNTTARIKDGGTVILGGWMSTRQEDFDSGVPLLRDIPFLGKLFFSREQKKDEKVTLNIFLTGNILRD
jgi:type II secretory pathway component GspD/PulD (secretin)